MTVSLGFAVFTFAIYVLSVARITRLINADTVLDPVRIALARGFGPDSKVLYFANCPWCVSIWVAAATAWMPLFFADNRVVQYFGLILAVSHLVGVAAVLSSDEDIEIETVEAA